ncbi:DNA mismatch repair protein MutS, partial [bacterium]|nr:DNA mismatch repair protein MutS [bacterium]
SRSYVGRLVDSGRNVAICEQTEDPRLSKGIVKREVIRLVTPGSIIDEGEVDDKSNLYIAAISGGSEKYGLAHVDLSTGEFCVTEIHSFNEVLNELGRIGPAELLVPENEKLSVEKGLSDYRVKILGSDSFDPERSESLLKEQLGVRSLVGFGCQDMSEGIIAAGALVHYLRDTQKEIPDHIREIVSYRIGDYMLLDESTCAHLELLKTMRRQSTKGSLFQILDRTVTPMGSRMLKKWIAYPLIQIDKIRNRSGAVSCFKDNPMFREEVREELKEIRDLERLNGRIALARANARDLLALIASIQRLPSIKNALSSSASTLLSEIALRLDTLEDIAHLIDESI